MNWDNTSENIRPWAGAGGIINTHEDTIAVYKGKDDCDWCEAVLTFKVTSAAEKLSAGKPAVGLPIDLPACPRRPIEPLRKKLLHNFIVIIKFFR